MGAASKELGMKEEKEKPKPTPGGPGGKIATKDMPEAHKQWMDYRIDGGELTWEEWLDQKWNK